MSKKNAKKTTKKNAPKTAKPKSGSGARIKQLLAKGWNAEKILAVVHREFRESKATKADVAWNKWDLKRRAKKGA